MATLLSKHVQSNVIQCNRSVINSTFTFKFSAFVDCHEGDNSSSCFSLCGAVVLDRTLLFLLFCLPHKRNKHDNVLFFFSEIKNEAVFHFVFLIFSAFCDRVGVVIAFFLLDTKIYQI